MKTPLQFSGDGARKKSIAISSIHISHSTTTPATTTAERPKTATDGPLKTKPDQTGRKLFPKQQTNQQKVTKAVPLENQTRPLQAGRNGSGQTKHRPQDQTKTTRQQASTISDHSPSDHTTGQKTATEDTTGVMKQPANTTKVAKQSANTTKVTKQPANTTKVTKQPANTTKATKHPANTTKATKQPTNTAKVTKQPANTTKVTKQPANTTKATKQAAESVNHTPDPTTVGPPATMTSSETVPTAVSDITNRTEGRGRPRPPQEKPHPPTPTPAPSKPAVTPSNKPSSSSAGGRGGKRGGRSYGAGEERKGKGDGGERSEYIRPRVSRTTGQRMFVLSHAPLTRPDGARGRGGKTKVR